MRRQKKYFPIFFLLGIFFWAGKYFYVYHTGVVYRGETSERAIALTIDDGPDPRYTPVVLDILKENGVRATFFVVGKQVEDYPELARRIVAEGHELGNHTYTHPHVENLGASALREEVHRANLTIERVAGVKPVWFRPPRKKLTLAEKEAVAQEGLQVALWTVALEHKAYKSPPEMVEEVEKKVEPGAIILLHDGRLDRSRTVAALPELIVRLKRKGYRFVTLSELMRKGEKNKKEGEACQKQQTREMF
ncbi:MAG: peptidoglycan-N-acetylglucosamine deacetylase [Eubacteriales bacterium]|nr:peptidoglycan-N-acetylglucosamine deacetylase [Eubacteriales bacterium]